jgi:hypothetical protein
MLSKKQPWPAELSRPIRFGDLQNGIRRDQSAKDFYIDLLNAAEEQKIKRANKLCEFICQYDDGEFFSSKLPREKDEWLYLVVVLCEYLNVPTFQVEDFPPRGPGATIIWNDQKLCELFADVMKLVTKGSKLSENAACRFIAANPEKFGSRYLRDGRNRLAATTLHRQFLATKSRMKNQPTFRISVLRKKRPELQAYGPALIEEVIEQYAFVRNPS